MMNLMWSNLVYVYSVFYKSLTFLKYIQKCISKTNKFDLKLKYKSNFQTKLEFKSLYMLDSSNSIQPSFSGVNTITYKSQNKMFRLFKVFLQLNLYTNTHVYKTHMTWKSFFITNSSSGIHIININKIYSKWKEFYYLILNLFYFNIHILFFGTSFFKKELSSFNWKLAPQISSLWRYIQPLFFYKSNKIINYSDFLFRKLKLLNFNIALLLDVTYHNKTIYYLHKVPFYTIGIVPINESYHTVNFAIPTASNNIFAQLFFIKFITKTKKITKNIEYNNLKNLWLDFYKFL